ncbi:SKI/DACH domain-containing protein 1-like [Arapaima gigas]
MVSRAERVAPSAPWKPKVSRQRNRSCQPSGGSTGGQTGAPGEAAAVCLPSPISRSQVLLEQLSSCSFLSSLSSTQQMERSQGTRVGLQFHTPQSSLHPTAAGDKGTKTHKEFPEQRIRRQTCKTPQDPAPRGPKNRRLSGEVNIQQVRRAAAAFRIIRRDKEEDEDGCDAEDPQHERNAGGPGNPEGLDLGGYGYLRDPEITARRAGGRVLELHVQMVRDQRVLELGDEDGDPATSTVANGGR